MDIILVRGTYDAGKTTTCAMLYEELLKTADAKHIFDFQEVTSNSLNYNSNGDVFDFIAIVTVKSKVVVIISAGDIVWKLMINIKMVIEIVKNRLNVEIDVLICCGRSQNREGSAFERLKIDYKSSKIYPVWPEWVENKSEIKSVKAKAVNEIMSLF